MRFRSLRIKNFRAIENFEILDLSDFVLIAGPNGCGKSCVFDAIRLLKSVYGGYQANEWAQWFSEFQINPNDPQHVQALFRDAETPVEIDATVELANTEIDYLTNNAARLVAPLAWARITGRTQDEFRYGMALATQFREFAAPVKAVVETEARNLQAALTAESFTLSLRLLPDWTIVPEPNLVMEIIFQNYRPDKLGIIDYHSASRSYQREAIGGVNLDVKQLDDQRMQQSLYNWQGKYQNVKTELATTYVRELVARQSGGDAGRVDLNETLKELFQTFFPEKEYLGVQPDPGGGLSFPVRTRSGRVHDINELSSGEKEVLYGYLRLRNSTPRNSTILLDEPELHLNPGLLRGFPDFYHRNLGKARNNQLWLVTHSDTLLRQAVGNSNYSVFHMTTAGVAAAEDNQALTVLADDDLERATIDLVGDLAMYLPKGKVVLFEGGGDTDIDVLITQRLFPTFAKSVNLISGGGKRRVGDLYDVLSRTAEKVGIANRFFAITDKDSVEWRAPAEGARQLAWDVYHIENYLLEPTYVAASANLLATKCLFDSSDAVFASLQVAAEKLVPSLVMERLRENINRRIISAINLAGKPSTNDPTAEISAAVERSFDRLDEARLELQDPTWLRSEAAQIEANLRAWLQDGSWQKEFPGRPILKEFVSSTLKGIVSYEAFRNVILDQMVDDAYEPDGMAKVINSITDTDTSTPPSQLLFETAADADPSSS